MWLALDCATRPGSPASLSVEKSGGRGTVFIGLPFDSLLKEPVSLRPFFLHYHDVRSLSIRPSRDRTGGSTGP
jgi:hypothetical protein